MMNYQERYLNGEFEKVWDELQALGPQVRKEPWVSAAGEVAGETMRRVRLDCETIISRLRSMGYTFGIYPDGSSGYYSEGPHIEPSPQMQKDAAELESQSGLLPLSLEAFWRVVGSVDLVGKGEGWPGLLDPLVIDPPIGPLTSLLDDEPQAGGQVEAPLAPDELHKDNLSGGSPYTVALPCDRADFRLLNERHGLLFVPYLRLAILRWGGFPGLDGQKVDFPPLKALTAGLVPF